MFRERFCDVASGVQQDAEPLPVEVQDTGQGGDGMGGRALSNDDGVSE